jgi:large subunit ribosomal protein L9
MQVLLFENIEKLGFQGDVVNVANGYFRNYLSPRGVAVEATQSNLRRHQGRRDKLKEEAAKQVQAAEAIGERLSATPVKFVMKATPDGDKLFGSVHDRDIAAILQEAGFEVERRDVVLAEPIKTVGTHSVKVKVHTHVLTELSVVVEAEAPPADEKTETEPTAEAQAPDAETNAETDSTPTDEAETKAEGTTESAAENAS